MPAGFAAPGVLFAGNSAAQDRAFYRRVFGALPSMGYSRYVEVGVGSFAATLVAWNAGIPPACMETSDVTLYTSIVGTLIAGGDLATLGVALDGEPVDIPDGTLVEQAAHLLYVQLLARTQAKAGVDYWENLVVDLKTRQDEHEQVIAVSLDGLAKRLAGLKYQPMCMWDHIALVADDPHTLIVAAPPSYKSGFEKFFNTDGRLTWSEPSYQIFDPAVDMQRLADEMADRAALLLFLQEDEVGKAAHKMPVFAHPINASRNAYVISNRPDEIFQITGGPRVSTGAAYTMSPYDLPMMPFDYEVRNDSTINLVNVGSSVADYYRNLWMHRLAGAPGNHNLLLIVDGFVAGVIGYSKDAMLRPLPGAKQWQKHILLRFAFGAPHDHLRLTRLATMVALRKASATMSMNSPSSALYPAASVGIITVEMTRHPEAKGLRGLMRLASRDKHPDGFKLIYESGWTTATLEETLTDFLTKEAKWRQQRKPSPASPGR